MAEPITVAAAKAHCRVLHDDEDSAFTHLIAAARETVEKDTDIVIVERRITIPFDRFANPLVLRKAWPIAATANLAIDYTNLAGAAATVTGAQLFSMVWPAQVIPAIGTSFPQAILQPESVRVGVNCGYAEGTVPFDLVQAMLMLIGHWYDNRETVIVGTISGEIALAYNHLIAPHARHIVG